MSDTNVNARVPEPYSLEDVMQAICAALLFGEDMGMCAANAMAEAVSGHATDVESMTLYPGAGNFVKVSPLAAQLLATAEGEYLVRSIGEPLGAGRTRYDLRRGAI